MKTFLLTGATGHLGRYLLKDLLLRGHHVAAIIRGNRYSTAEQRLQTLFESIQAEVSHTLPSPVCIPGDTTKPNFGMTADDIRWVKLNCSLLLHSAASIQFEGGVTAETMQVNRQHAKRAVEMMRTSDLEHLAYVSTAYVCGQQSGPFREDQLDCEQSFRNEYEHSKFEAEKIVRQSMEPSQLTVLRPAIIVGDSRTAHTAQFHHVYRFAQFTALLANAAPKDELGHWIHNVRLTLSPEKELNLVPVDWVSAAIVEILQRRSGTDSFNTYHLTPSRSTQFWEIEKALQLCFNYSGVKFVGAATELTDLNTEERYFYGYVSDYLDYMKADPIFDRSNTDRVLADLPDPAIDLSCLERLFQYAIDSKFGRGKSRSKSQKTTTAIA